MAPREAGDAAVGRVLDPEHLRDPEHPDDLSIPVRCMGV
jgi:hypothetical protein